MESKRAQQSESFHVQGMQEHSSKFPKFGKEALDKPRRLSNL